MGHDSPPVITTSKINSLKQQNLSLEFAVAIKKIELFSDEFLNEKLNFFKSPINFAKRAKEYAKSFIIKFSNEQNNKEEDELLKAIRTIQKNYFFIQKLKKGTLKEQFLADSAIKVIERYNQIIEQSKKEESSLTTLFKAFIYKKWGLQLPNKIKKEIIHLPKEAFIRFQNAENEERKEDEKTQDTASHFFQGNEPISQNEADAFRAKAISLLQAKVESKEIQFTSIKEQFQTIRSTPIQAMIRQEDLRIMLAQVLKPFPGEMITFKGEFQRDSLFNSTPLKKSFEIFSQSHQTGFPHPIQHTGWALDACMIPLYVEEPSRLKKILPLFEKKEKIASELLPKGNLIFHAKKILKLKTEIFEEQKEKWIHKLIELNLAISEASGHLKTENELSILTNFFEDIKKSLSSYQLLGETQELVLQNFIRTPFELVKDHFIEQNSFYEEDQKNVITALAILEKEQLRRKKMPSNTNKEAYLNYMGGLISSSANSIILQHLSESMGFTPPTLSLFEQKMQASLYHQLLSFQKELLTEDFDKKRLLTQFFQKIDEDIEIFKAHSLEELCLPLQDIVRELNTYYSKK